MSATTVADMEREIDMERYLTEQGIDDREYHSETKYIYDEWNRLQREGADDLCKGVVEALAPEPGGYRELARRLHAAASAFEALADLPDTIDGAYREAVRQEDEYRQPRAGDE